MSLGPDVINTVIWKHYIGLYLFEWKFKHVLQCFLGLMLSSLKAVLVMAANMTLAGSLPLGRVSFHGFIYMWVHCMPMLESTEVFGRCLSFHFKEPILLLNCPCKHILLKEASFLASYCIKKIYLKFGKMLLFPSSVLWISDAWM